MGGSFGGTFFPFFDFVLSVLTDFKDFSLLFSVTFLVFVANLVIFLFNLPIILFFRAFAQLAQTQQQTNVRIHPAAIKGKR